MWMNLDGSIGKPKPKVEVIYAKALGTFRVIYKPVPRRGPSWMPILPGQGADGYGSKITTDWVVVFNGDTRKIKHRVYATCYSNAASHWIMVEKQKYHLMDGDFPERS